MAETWTDEQRALRFPSYLDGMAKKWFNHCKANDYPGIKAAFIEHFKSLFGQRTEYEAYNWDQQEPLLKFIDAKEEKAMSAGIPKPEAIKHLIANAGLPYQFRLILAACQFNTFNDFKATVSQMVKTQQQRPRQPLTYPNPYVNTYRPHSQPRQYGRMYGQVQNARFAQKNRFAGRPPLCQYCKAIQKHNYHWHSECWYIPENQTANNRLKAARPPFRG